VTPLVAPGPSVPLNTGAAIPQVGFGVYQAKRGEETRGAVAEALRAGYRHVDTAMIYENEADVGVAVRDSGIPRSDLFITSKLWNDDQGYDEALRAYDGALERMGLEYLDLFLLHWPEPGKRLDSWRALERLVGEGRLRAAGVSNFMVHHLEELLAVADIVPAVNQIEVSPFLQQREVRAACRRYGIVVEAYSSLTKARRLDHPTLLTVADEADRTPAQVLLRWGVQHGLVVIPKSVRPARIAENAELFDFQLGNAHMETLDGLEEGLVTGWDPREAP
jgi:diketogulonate reductase-like aldo/keto reductase